MDAEQKIQENRLIRYLHHCRILASPGSMLSRSARLILITFLFSQQVAAQDSRPGFRLIRDKGEVVGVDYFGAAGLEQAKLHEYPKLESVHFVYGTEITRQDIRYLAKLKNLVELKMGFAGVDSEYVTVDGKLNELSKLKKLEAIHLCKQFMRDEDLRFIGDLPELECLEFNANTNGHGKPGPTATDDCVKHLVKAKSLRDLCILGEVSFSDQFVKDLTSGLPGLEHLEIASDQLTDETLRRLGTRCKNLKWLNVSSKRFTDEGIDLLSQSNRLERLWGVLAGTNRKVLSLGCRPQTIKASRVNDEED